VKLKLQPVSHYASVGARATEIFGCNLPLCSFAGKLLTGKLLVVGTRGFAQKLRRIDLKRAIFGHVSQDATIPRRSSAFEDFSPYLLVRMRNDRLVSCKRGKSSLGYRSQQRRYGAGAVLNEIAWLASPFYQTL
jgi:hypothetical protein